MFNSALFLLLQVKDSVAECIIIESFHISDKTLKVTPLSYQLWPSNMMAVLS